MVDFFSELPLEIVQHIIDYLKVPDVLKCLCVCKRWHHTLSLGEMAPFWRRACVYGGFPVAYVQKRLSNSSKSPNELYRDVIRHKSIVTAQRPVIRPIGGVHPFNRTEECEYAGGGFFIKIVESASKEEEVVVGEFCSEKNIVVRDAYKPGGKCGQVIWSNCMAGNLLFQTGKGRWFRYVISDRRFIELTVSDQDKGRYYTTGYCRHCLFLVFTSTDNFMSKYHWILYFINFSDGRDNKPLELRHKTEIPPRTTQYIPTPAKSHLLPIVPGDCSQGHQVIVQGGSGACVYNVTHSDKDGIQVSPKPVGKLNPFFDIKIAVMVVNTTSEMTLSANGDILGLITNIVYPFKSGLCLHIFDVKTFERISSKKLDWKDGFDDGCVLAVNRLYAAIAVSHSDGCIKLMHVHTGKCLLEVSGLQHGPPPIVPMSRLVLIHYQGTYNEESMLDVSNPLGLVVVYRQGIKNLQYVLFSPQQALTQQV